jgi:hypothetical protein
MRFSERGGYKTIRSVLQIEGIDARLRNVLWNVINLFIIHNSQYAHDKYGHNFLEYVWIDYYGGAFDEMPTNFVGILRKEFLDGKWFEFFDLIEYFLEHFQFNDYTELSRDNFISECNFHLAHEMSAYRIVSDSVVRLTSESELEAIEQAAALSNRFAPVATHMRRALELLSDRTEPDYRNSIKEAISAVESMCAILTENPKATLGDALKQLEASGVNVHPRLRGAFSQLYGFTSDAQGIRHKLLEEPTLDFEDAKFMLVSCSAFVNLLRARSAT